MKFYAIAISTIIAIALLEQTTEAKPWEDQNENFIRESEVKKTCNRYELAYSAIDCVKDPKGPAQEKASQFKGQCGKLYPIMTCLEELYSGCSEQELQWIGILTNWQKFQQEVYRICDL